MPIRHINRTLSAVLLISQLSVAELFDADSTGNTRFRIPAVRISRDLDLSGTLSDPLWKTAPSVELKYEIQPGENSPAPERTTAKILYNERYLYVGFICYDSHPSQIRAHISDRDKIFDDDFAIILLDPYGDFNRVYEIAVNPYGIQGDLMRVGSTEDDTFDMIYLTKAKINAKGWTAEMAIPFKSLRFPPKADQEWAISLARIIPRMSRVLTSWTPYDRNNPCLQCQGGYLTGIRDVDKTSSFELLPYGAMTERGSLRDDSNPGSVFDNEAVRGKAGIGIQYSPTPAFVLNGVVNPDFSQVESDATQISVNSTFALFYPEKRPFFLEGADLFTTKLTAFYSRVVNNPIAAAKLTEKSGGLSIGYLGAEDRDSPFIVPGEEGSEIVESSIRSATNILRAKYSFPGESFVGVMGTARNFTDAHNYVAGADWNIAFGGNNYFRGEVLASDTKELRDTSLFSSTRHFGRTKFNAGFDGQSYQGTALKSDLLHSGRNYVFLLTYTDIAPTFQSQSGFIGRIDQRLLDMQNQYTFYPDNSIVDLGYVFVQNGVEFDYAGSRTERYVIPGAGAQLKSQTNINFGYLLVNEELFHNVHFTGVQRAFFTINSKPVSTLSLNINAETGRFIYRTDTPEIGEGHNLTVDATIRLTSRLLVDLGYSRARLSRTAGGELLYDGYIARPVLIYQFTPEMYIRLITQYDQFSRTADVYPLFSYKLNPYTIFYAGLTQTLNNYGPPVGGRTTSRQFFVKLQYLWRN